MSGKLFYILIQSISPLKTKKGTTKSNLDIGRALAADGDLVGRDADPIANAKLRQKLEVAGNKATHFILFHLGGDQKSFASLSLQCWMLGRSLCSGVEALVPVPQFIHLHAIWGVAKQGGSKKSVTSQQRETDAHYTSWSSLEGSKEGRVEK